MKNFAEIFDKIFAIYCELSRVNGGSSSLLAFSRFLGHVHDGRVRAWKKGQWPTAEDIRTLHEKMGLSLEWLMYGTGEPFRESAAAAAPALSAEGGAGAILKRIEELELEIARKTKELAETKEERDQYLRELVVVQRTLLSEREDPKRDRKEEPGETAQSLREPFAGYGNKTLHEPRAGYGRDDEHR